MPAFLSLSLAAADSRSNSLDDEGGSGALEKNVSSHRLISSGVRSVHIKLHYYDLDIVANQTDFAFFHTNNMCSYLNNIEHAIFPSDPPMGPSYVMPA